MSVPDRDTPIRSSGEFSSLLRDIKASLADRELRQILEPSAKLPRLDSVALVNVNDIPNEGPWPDYIELYFEDPAGKHYRLSVDTYHGGGSWTRL